MGSLLLHTAAGAGKGLEDLLTRLREEEMVAQRGRATDAGVRNIESEITTRNSTTDRLNRGADIANQSAQSKLDAQKRIMAEFDKIDGGGNGMPGTPVDATSMPGKPSTPQLMSGGISSLNTPEGRTIFQAAGYNPNESFGSVPQPKIPKGPEDLSAEEVFYTGLAKKAGFPDYKAWAAAHPEGIAAARHKWAEQSFTPVQMSPQVVQIADPNNPQRTVYADRSGAIGQTGPLPTDQRDKITAYNATLDLVDRIEQLGKKTGWKGLGPIEGRVGRIGMEYLGMGNPDEEALRNALDKLKAAASFQEGGKQFTGTEKELLEAFLAGVNQNPAAVRTRLQSFKESAIRSLEAMGAPRKGAQPTGSSTGSGGSDDWYQQYLDRTKKPGGGGL